MIFSNAMLSTLLTHVLSPPSHYSPDTSPTQDPRHPKKGEGCSCSRISIMSFHRFFQPLVEITPTAVQPTWRQSLHHILAHSFDLISCICNVEEIHQHGTQVTTLFVFEKCKFTQYKQHEVLIIMGYFYDRLQLMHVLYYSYHTYYS